MSEERGWSRALDELAVAAIRVLSMDAVEAARSGHPGAPMGLAPLGWTIFSRLRRHDPAAPDWAGRDRFVLSCGHASMLHYALLHLSGYDLPLAQIRRFRQLGSATPGHPEYGHTPGIEVTTGPLGQGLAHAVGMAMAARHLSRRFDRGGSCLFSDQRIWVVASDGDLMEGVVAEAASLAGHLRLGRLVVFWDDNRITIDGSTDLAFTEDVLRRFEAYGWQVLSVDDGEDLDGLEATALAAVRDPRPSMIRVRTVIGWPAPRKGGTAAAHGAPLGAEEVAAVRERLGWRLPPFELPSELSEAATVLRDRGQSERAAWEARRAAWAEAHPALASELDRVLQGAFPEGWEEGLPCFEPSRKGLATRKASARVLGALTERLPELVGGSADLTGSNGVVLPEPDFRVGEGPVGGVPRAVHWGVREHAMAAAAGGMALFGGVRPLTATFLVFSDYMRPSMRLAAMMRLPVRYVFTHDSIGLGEDGPTHQPVEHLAALRAIPRLAVFRPADAEETRACWVAALQWEGPSAMVLTRQPVPVLDRAAEGFASAEEVARGGYVLAEADGGEPRALLVSSGSEVHLALEARSRLQAEGVPTRVVSMPCWELFEAQPLAWREAVFPDSVPCRVVVEAGCRQGWSRWVGADAGFVTLEDFGASAPYEQLYEHFGITVERIVEEARARL